MAVTPLRLFGPANLPNTPEVLYSVPPVTKTVVNFIHVNNPTAVAVGLTISINSDGGSTRIYDSATASFQPGATPIFCNHVLEAGETLQGFSSDPNLVLTIDGEQRTL